MKTQVTEHIVNSSMEKGHAFTISKSEEGVRMLHDLLRSKLYSDPIKSLIRETLSNSIDACVEAKVDPSLIKIKLPNSIDSTFSIADRGLGITPKKIIEVVTVYFESTKRDSNDYLGSRGVGFKSPFGYTNVFTVETIVEHSLGKNIKYLYSCYIDEKSVGRVSLVNETITTEPTGTCISFGVRSKDFDYFRDCVTYYLSFTNFTTNLEVAKPEVLLEGKGWQLINKDYSYSSYNEKCTLIVGTIPYPINSNKFKSEEMRLLSCNVNLYCNIGDVSLPYSKEDLHYDERTTAFLEALIESIYIEVVEVINSKISNCSTIGEAFEYYKSLPYGVKQLDRFTWKGISLYNSVRRLSAISIKLYRFNGNSKWENVEYLDLAHSKVLQIYEDIDTKLVPNLTRKIKLLNGYDYVYLIKAKSYSSLLVNVSEDYFYNLINLSDLVDELNTLYEEDKKLRRESNQTAKKINIGASKGCIKVRCVRKGPYRVYDLVEENKSITELETEGATVIKLVGFRESSTAIENNLSLWQVAESVEKLCVTKAYFVKSSDWPKVSNLKSLSQMMEEVVGENVKSSCGMNIQELKDELIKLKHKYCKLYYLPTINGYRDLEKLKVLSDLIEKYDDTSPIKALIDFHLLIRKLEKVASVNDIKIPVGSFTEEYELEVDKEIEDMIKPIEELVNKYYLAYYFIRNKYGGLSDSDICLVKEYIKKVN